MQRREDLVAARLGRAPGPVASLGVGASGRLQSPQAAASPRRPPRGGGGAARGNQPPPLLPPSATGSGPPPPSAVPPPLMPGATSAAKAEPENNKYLPELMAEKDSLDPSFTHATQLLQAGKVRSERGRGREKPPAPREGGRERGRNAAFPWIFIYIPGHGPKRFPDT